MINKNSTRRRDLTHNVEGCADHKSRNSFAFDNMGDETDGLVAKRSVRHQ
jgi:hypothetical protein